MNSKAVTSLTFGIISIFLPVIGIIFGIIGITAAHRGSKEIEESGDEGKGFAIAGKVCSIVGICLQTTLVILAALGAILFFTV